jgi:hypothetical protein
VSVDAPQLPVPTRPVARGRRPPGRCRPGSGWTPGGGPARRPDNVAAPIRMRGVETLLVFLIAWLVFAAIGYRAVVMQHIVPADALNLMSRAFYVWHNDPAKLAAIGFTGPPLQTVGLLPFAIVKPLASSLVALPVASGFWGAFALMLLHRTMARCGVPMVQRIGLTVLIAANPMWLFYAGVGMPDMIYLTMMAATVYFIFTWVIEDQARFVAGVGLTLALMGMSRFGFIWLGIAIAIVATLVLRARKADSDESEGLLVTLMAPTAAALVIWILACALITSDPFGWLFDAQPFGGVSSDSRTQPISLMGVLEHGGALIGGVAPVAVLALLGLLWRWKSSDRIAAGQAFLIVAAILVVIGNALVHDDLSLLTMRSALPLMVLGIGAAIWLVRGHGTTGTIMAFTSLALAIPITAFAMDRYPYQNLEQSFVRATLTQRDQEGSTSRGGYRVGIQPEQRMAAFIKVLAGRDHNTVLADNATTGGVILLTGRPEVFLDRVDQGDAYFLRVLKNPWGRINYIVVARGTDDGSINQIYPRAATGGAAGLRPVYTAGRYVLLSVAATDPKVSAAQARAALEKAARTGTTGTGSAGTTGSTGSGTTGSTGSGTTGSTGSGTTGSTGGGSTGSGGSGSAGSGGAGTTDSTQGTSDGDAGLDAPILTPVP